MEPGYHFYGTKLADPVDPDYLISRRALATA